MTFGGLLVSDPDTLAKTRASISVTGTIEHRGVDLEAADVEVNQIVRVQSDNAIDGNIHAVATGAFVGTATTAIGQIRANKDLAGNIVALDGDIFSVRVLDPGTPLSGEAITGDILAENGHIGIIYSTRPIGDGSNQPKIYAGNGIEQIRCVDDSVPEVVTVLDRDIHADIRANRNYTLITPGAGIDPPQEDAPIHLIETAGNLSGEVRAGNISFTAGVRQWGILVGGTITAPITVDLNLETADILAASIEANVKIGVRAKGAIVAMDETSGVIWSVDAGFGTTAAADVYATRYPRGFSGHGNRPRSPGFAAPVDSYTAADWTTGSVFDGGSVDSVIRASHIGTIHIDRMTQVWGVVTQTKEFLPRIESPNIDSLQVQSFRSGVVWSGKLVTDSNGAITSASFDDPYAAIGEVQIGCLWGNADLWVKACPAMTIGYDIRGRVHLPTLEPSETIFVGRELGDANAGGTIQCPCTESTTDPCAVEGDRNADLLSEPSPRRGQLRGTTVLTFLEHGEILTRHADGLHGQIVLNKDAAFATGFTGWEGLVTLGEFDSAIDRITLAPTGSQPDRSPLYDRASVDLGNGSVGVVAYGLHGEDCRPAHDHHGRANSTSAPREGVVSREFASASGAPVPIPVLAQSYGPVRLADGFSISDALAVEVQSPSDPCMWVDVTGLFTPVLWPDINGNSQVDPFEHRYVGLKRKGSAIPFGGVYRLISVGLVCDEVLTDVMVGWPIWTPPAAACCVGSTCQVMSWSECQNSSGTYQGAGVTCSTLVCPNTPLDGIPCIGPLAAQSAYVFQIFPDCDGNGINDLKQIDDARSGGGEIDANHDDIIDSCMGPMGACACDASHDGCVTVQDIFDFLFGYFQTPPCTGQTSLPCNGINCDINASGAVTVQDIFDFLACYFANSCGGGSACRR